MFGHFHLTFACFQIEERGETEVSRAWSGERMMEAEAGARAAPCSGAATAGRAAPSGHRDTGGPVVSLTSGVSVSVGPSHSAELPSQQPSQPIQFTVEFRRAMSSSHTSHTCPPCHMWV